MLPHDPDTWLLHLRTPDAIKKWLATEKDYLVDYLPPVLQARGSGPKAMNDAIKEMGAKLELIPDDTLRGIYFDEVGKGWPAFKKNYKLHKRENIELPKLEKLKTDERSAFFDFGFYTQDGAYWTLDRGKPLRICNFTIDILFFVRSENQPKYVCLFKNMFGRSRVAAITTDDFTTVGTFRKIIGRLGHFIFEGSDIHLNKIKMKIFFGVREAEEPKYMGYNPHGNFYTWANGLYHSGAFYKSDKYGIVQLKQTIDTMDRFKSLHPETHVIMGEEIHILENPEKFLEANPEATVQAYIESGKAWQLNFYFLPFSTNLKISDHDDDDFEFERKFRYYETEKPSFTGWSQLMRTVYGDNGCVAVAYYVMSLFRDIVYKANNNYIPLLGFFGPRGSGKSTCARSLNKMFGDGLEDGVNLESGSTATGIRRYMASMQNAILWLNEYRNSLPDYTLGMIKGIADGSGKLTGRNTGGNETKNYKPRCTVVFGGQDLPTKDPAILSRTVICEFDAKDRNRDKLDELIAMENSGAGTGITCELLNERTRVKELYAKLEPIVTKIIRAKCMETIGEVDDRLILNVTSLLTTMIILAEPEMEGDGETKEEQINALINAPEEKYKIQIGFKLSHLARILVGKLKMQVDIQHTSDDIEQYFQVLMSLVERGQVKEGHHYKITKEADGKARLWLRVGVIHALYRQAAGQAGYAVMDSGTLRSYLMKHKSAIEYREKGVRFGSENNPTSAMVMNYDLLLSYGIELKMNMAFDKTLTEDNELMK